MLRRWQWIRHVLRMDHNSTLHDCIPVGARWEKEAKKIQNNLEENCEEGKTNMWTESMGTSKDHRTG